MRKFTIKRTEELIEKYGKPIAYKNNIPILKAIKKNGYQIRMFCLYCQDWHSHGFTESLGHRSAHCYDTKIGRDERSHNDSPYCETGYYILLVDGEEKD